MRFGCCGSIVSTQQDGTGVEIIEELEEIGYDYIELSLAAIMALPESAFTHLKKRVHDSDLKCEACNNFFPPHIRLTGSHVDWPKVEDYTTQAMDRAAQLGAEIIVFGSAGAKNVPEGFPMDRAWEQIVHALRMIDPIAGGHGITIAIEPLNKAESNIVNTTREGLELAEQVNRKNVKLLVDYYHLVLEDEDPSIILQAGDAIIHTHLAKDEGRVFPSVVEDRFRVFFANLKEVGYQARVSVEGFSQDFHRDAVRALAVLKQLDEET